MRRLEISGGWYADAHPSGAYAVTVDGQHVATDEGPVAFPGENILYLRLCLFAGHRYLAGVGHQTDQAWLWANRESGGWKSLNPAAGVNACAFWPNRGYLWVCRGGDQADEFDLLSGGGSARRYLATGSQGIRWIRADGTILTGDATYVDKARGLWEYTDYGDVAIGQGPETGCVVRFAADGLGRLLEPGAVRFVRVQRMGDQFAVSMTRQDIGACVIVWATLDELRALPVAPWVTVPAPAPVSLPAPTPAPVPKDGPMKLTDAEKATLTAFAAAFPMTTVADEDGRRAWTWKLAQTFAARFPAQGWGTKRASSTRPLSKDAVARIVDGIIWSWDVVTGGNDPLKLNPNADAENISASGQVFVPVDAHDWIGGTVEPPVEPEVPGPEVPPTTPPDADLVARVKALEEAVVALRRWLGDTFRSTPF
jgi:hypothetical protein